MSQSKSWMRIINDMSHLLDLWDNLECHSAHMAGVLVLFFFRNSLITLLFSLCESDKILRLLTWVTISRSVAIELIVLQRCALKHSVCLKKKIENEKKYSLVRRTWVLIGTETSFSGDNYVRGGIFHDHCGRSLILNLKYAKPNSFIAYDIIISTQQLILPQTKLLHLLLLPNKTYLLFKIFGSSSMLLMACAQVLLLLQQKLLTPH